MQMSAVNESYRSINTCCHRVVCSNPIGFENYWTYTYCRWFILFDNNVKVHWHYRSPKCARPGRISGTLCLNAPFARVCENSYLHDMAHVIIKCRVTFGKKCSMIVLNHILVVCDLYFRHSKSFRLSGRIMGTLPYMWICLSIIAIATYVRCADYHSNLSQAARCVIEFYLTMQRIRYHHLPHCIILIA